ncbi:MAG: hypothetical protein IKT43_03860 [Clostridia bacterium]|nr:hypothetical protein [Clostridia bacterium]
MLKRLCALLLCLCLFFSSVPVFALDSGIKSVEDISTSFDARLLSAAKAVLMGEEVAQAYREAVLFSDSAVRTTAQGTPLAVSAPETVLGVGERVRMQKAGLLKIYTTCKVRTNPGEEEAVYEIRRFELKTVYLSQDARFWTYRTEEGFGLFLEHGSLAYTYCADMFADGAFELSAKSLVLAAGENYLSLASDEAGVSAWRLGGRKSVEFTFGDLKSTLPEFGGVCVTKEGSLLRDVAPVTLGGEALERAAHSEALLQYMTENSAMADGVLRAMSAQNVSADVNTLRDLYLKAIASAREARARAYVSEDVERVVCPLTAGDFATMNFTSALSGENAGEEYLLTLPKSNAAYTVSDSGKTLDLADLRDKVSLDVYLTLFVPLTDKRDDLKLCLGEETYPVVQTEGISTYIFRLPMADLLKIYAEDPSPKALSVDYQTQKTNLFFDRESATYETLDTEIAVEGGKPYTVTVRMKDTLYAGDEFYLLFMNSRGEQKRVAPTAQPQETGVYLFTVEPTAGANFAELVCTSLYEVRVENGFGSAYSAVLFGTAGEGLAAANSIGVLYVSAADRGDFVPVVLQKNGDEVYALSEETGGRYVLSPIGADTTVSLSLGYPVFLPKANELFSVEPMAGFAADYAEALGEYRFKVHLSRDASLGTSILVKNNGVTLTPDDAGVYVIAEVTQPIRLTVTHGVTHSVFLPTSEDYTVVPYGGDGTTVLENGTFRFTLQTKDADVASLVVSANESVIKPDGAGIYTVSGIKRDVYITVRMLSSFRVILPLGEGFVASPFGEAEETVAAGGTWKFTVTPDASLHPASTFTVLANGVELLADEAGVYQIENVSEDVVVAVKVRRAYSVQLPEDGEFFELATDGAGFALHGDSYTFSVAPKGGKNVTVYANGRVLQGVGTTYTVENVTGDLYISVLGETGVPTCLVSIRADVSLSVSAITSTEVMRGGDFVFAVTLSGANASGGIQVNATSGSLKVISTNRTSGALVMTYLLSGIMHDSVVTVDAAK